MHDPNADRRAELVAAALAGELTAAEEAELAALDAAHPDASTERAELAALVARLEGLEAWNDEHAIGDRHWDDVEPSAALAERIAAIGDEPQHADDAERSHVAPAAVPDAPASSAPLVSLAARRRSRRLLLPLVAGAAACLAIGVGIGAAAFGERDATVVQGPPGTLGAVEEIAFADAPSSIAIEGALVAHTWGTETVLAIDGLPAGEAFTVVVIGEDGTEFASGAMLGSDVTIDCRLNAAVLREDVAAVEIRAASGDEIAHADVVDV